MGVRDIEIIPPFDKKVFLEGFLGVTPTLTLNGSVVLHTTARTKIRFVKIGFEGFSRTKLIIDKKKYVQERSAVQKEQTLLQPDLAAKKAKKFVVVEKGEKQMAFEIKLDQPTTSKLLASFEGHPALGKKDEAIVQYQLVVEVGVARNPMMALFGKPTKFYKRTLVVDVPKADLEAVKTCEMGRPPFEFKRSTDAMDLIFSLENTSLCIGKPVKLTLNEGLLREKGEAIKKIDVAIRQEETFRCDGQQKTFKDMIGELTPEKFSVKKTDIGGQEVWKGEGLVLIPTFEKKQGGGLFSSGKTVVVHGSFESELISVRHYIEVTVHTKNADFKIEEAVIVLEADQEVRTWAMKHGAERNVEE